MQQSARLQESEWRQMTARLDHVDRQYQQAMVLQQQAMILAASTTPAMPAGPSTAVSHAAMEASDRSAVEERSANMSSSSSAPARSTTTSSLSAATSWGADSKPVSSTDSGSRPGENKRCYVCWTNEHFFSVEDHHGDMGHSINRSIDQSPSVASSWMQTMSSIPVQGSVVESFHEDMDEPSLPAVDHGNDSDESSMARDAGIISGKNLSSTLCRVTVLIGDDGAGLHEEHSDREEEHEEEEEAEEDAAAAIPTLGEDNDDDEPSRHSASTMHSSHPSTASRTGIPSLLFRSLHPSFFVSNAAAACFRFLHDQSKIQRRFWSATDLFKPRQQWRSLCGVHPSPRPLARLLSQPPRGRGRRWHVPLSRQGAASRGRFSARRGGGPCRSHLLAARR